MSKQNVALQVSKTVVTTQANEVCGVLSDNDIVTKVELSPGTKRSKLLEERNCSGQVPLMYIY